MNLIELKEISEAFGLFENERKDVSLGLTDFINPKTYKLESVTFFGGSFNPLHEGHLECIRLCPEENIIVVPDRNPLKACDERDIVSELIDLAGELRDFKVSIYPGFFIKNEKNPTSTWINRVNRKEVNFLMGDDSYMSILSWINPEIILNSLTKLYVVPRLYKQIDYQKQLDKILLINPRLKVIFLSEHNYQNLSSTKLRN